MTTSNPATVHQQHLKIKQTIARVEKEIEQVTEMLLRYDKLHAQPDRHDVEIGECMSGDLRIWCLIHMRKPPAWLRDELLGELAGFQIALKELRLRERHLARRVRRKRMTDRKSRDFKKQLEEIFREAEKKGALDEDEMASLLEDAEEVLGDYLYILQAHASIENIDAVVKHLTLPIVLSGDATRGKAGEAWYVLNRAAKQLQAEAQADFERVPSVGNFDRVLRRMQLAMAFGHGELELPKGLEHVSRSHTVVPGETLASIAKHYYGKAIFCPHIYMANFQQLDPTKLPVGMTIRIP